MAETPLFHPTHTDSSTAQVLAFLGIGVSNHIQIFICGLLLVMLADLASILFYFFSFKGQKFSKQDSAEESKEKATKSQKDPLGHKCADATCKHSKHVESDFHVEEDENLVFDEQADVVFMQPGFNIKDSTTSGNAAKS
jgi:hypothetical protein